MNKVRLRSVVPLTTFAFSSRATGLVVMAVLFFTATTQRRADAITIEMEYTDEGAPTPHPENPIWDPDGTILKAHFQAAKARWEALLPDPGTYQFDFHWDDDIGATTLGLTTDAGVLDVYIEINPNFNWFADPTPTDDQEFAMPANQTLFSGLSPTEQSTFFPGTAPPGALETAYWRPGSAGVPGTGGFDAQNGFDLLTVIVHEMGHVLGISSDPLGEPGEYNIDPYHVSGLENVLVLEGDGGHLAGNATVPGFLMCDGCATAGGRYYPSATDVLVIAEDQGLSTVQLQRVGRIASGVWSEANRWIGGAVPGPAQDVYISHGGTVTLDANVTVKDLLVAGVNTVLVQNHSLNVNGTLTFDAATVAVGVGGTISANSIVRGPNDLATTAGSLVRFNEFKGGASTSASFSGKVAIGYGVSTDPVVTFDPMTISNWTIAEQLAIGDETKAARLVIDGAADFTSGTGRLGSDSSGGVQGSVEIDGAGSSWTVIDSFDAPNAVVSVKNRGLLVTGSATLGSDYGQTYATIDNATWSINGNASVGPTATTGQGLGRLTIQNAALASIDGDVNVHGTTTLVSEIAIQSGAHLDVGGAVVVGPFGLVTYHDSTAATAGIFGAEAFACVGGTVDGGAGGVTRFVDNASAGASHLTNHPGGTTFAGAGHTEFRNNASAASGRFDNLPGTVSYQSGATRFYDNATGGNGEFYNHPGFLNIYATIEFNGDSTGGNGTFTNLAGVLSQSVGGAIVFNDRSRAGIGTYTSTGEGGLVIFYDDSNADHGTFSTADNVGGNSVIQFHNNASAGDATFTIRTNTSVQFHGNSTAGNATFSLLRPNPLFGTSGGVLSVSSGSLDHANITVEGGNTFGYPGGSISMQNATSSAGNATINLFGGVSAGAAGAQLRFDYGSSAGAADITAHGGTNGGGGSLVAFARGARGEDSHVTIHSGAVLDVSGNWLYGGTFIGALDSAGSVVLGGALLTTGALGLDTTISGVIADGLSPGGQLTKVGPGTLSLDGDNTYTGLTVVEAGTLAVNGSIPGDAVIASAAALGGAGTIGGSVNNYGFISPGASPGALSIDGDFTQTAAGVLLIELASVSSFDQLLVTGSAALAGALQVDLFAGFLPSSADMFEILTATSLTGGFDNVASGERVDTVGGGGSFLVSYDGITNAVWLSDFLGAVLLGDVNGDGNVNGLDVHPFVDVLINGPFDVKADMNEDGNVNGLDVDPFVAAVLGGGVMAAASGMSVPEPGTGLLLWAGVGVLVLRPRRQRGCGRPVIA